MSHFAGWISPDVMRTLGWALVHFLWQGIALAALAAIGMELCRSAATRYVIAVGALVLMLASPVATFVALWQSPADRVTPVNASSMFAPTFATPAQRDASPSSSNTLFQRANGAPFSSHSDALLWFVEAWFAGVIVLSLRTAGGVLLIERMRRRDAKPVSARIRQICLAVQWRLGLMRAIQYCESQLLDAPAVIGWIRPAVLLPVTALTGLSDEQLQAVIAHELAHIRRFDNIVNVFQILVETLLFYHPAVWWVSKRIRVERENCCDDAAVSVCTDPMQYARALAMMAELHPAPALAMAANRGPLTARVARLLGVANQRNSARNAGIAASFILLAGAAFAANAFFGIAHSALASALPVHGNNFRTPPPAYQTSRSLSATSPASGISHEAAPSNSPIAPPAVAHDKAAPAFVQEQQEQKQNDQNQQANTGSTAKQSYIEAMKAAGFDNLTADGLIALKIQDVTPEYVRGLHDLGLKPTVDELIGLKVQGVTPEYIRDMRAAGVSFNVDKLIGLKVQGITPDYVRAMHDLGIAPDSDELIGLRVQRVTPEYIKQMHDLGIPAKADEIIGMKVQGVTPDYIQQMRALGLKATADQIIGMKVQGLTPEYVKGLRATGLPDFKDDPDCYIGAKIQGITPGFVAEAQKHGFKDLDLDKLIALKNAGVF